MTSRLRLEAEVMSLRTRHPFIIARHGFDEVRSIRVVLRDADGLEGIGEATPQKFYGETPETALAALDFYAPRLPENIFLLEQAEADLARAMTGNNSVRAALSTALHDLVGKRLGVPIYRLWGLDPATAPISTFTIGIDTPEKMRLKVREAAPYPVLKVKLGTADDLAILQAIREETTKELRVDANCAWTAVHAVRMLPVLEEFGVTILEQPVARADLDGFAQIRRHARIPLIADESCHVATDIPHLAGRVDGINIKLAKTGSLREALRMVAVARAHHLMVMLGCMVESSIAITAAAHLAPLVDLIDLDGAALLAEDPWVGATIEEGRLQLPEAPGLGVRPR
ncbi:MAG: dipeptide epimerase [Gemmatimonadota bacterium]|nr:dipeptide epimerase [Gemmatimonadota bacterium]